MTSFPDSSSSQAPPQPVRESALVTQRAHNAAPTQATDAVTDSPTDPELLKQQIKLIQLCFGEHEFGVPLDSAPTGDEQDATTATLSSSSTVAELRPFDAKQFVNSKLGHGVSLEVICKDLDVFVEHVQGKIKRHVNMELHDAFITASGQLVGMEAELECVQKPLVATVKRVGVATGQINDVERALQSKMQYACDAEKERLFDTTFLRGLLLYEALVDYMEGVEPTLRDDLFSVRAARFEEEEPSRAPRATPLRGASSPPQLSASNTARPSLARAGQDSTSPATTSTMTALQPSTLHHLERMAQTSAQLQQVVNLLPPLSHRDKDAAEMQQLADSASAAVWTLVQQAFCRVCDDFFEQPTSTVTQQLRQIMHIYLQANAEARFVTMFSNTVLRPFFDSVLSWKAATLARQSTEQMVSLIGVLYDSIQNKLSPLLLLIRRTFRSQMMPIVELLWPALCEGLIKKLVTLYDAAIPEAFHQKYVSAYRLYGLVESLCGSRDELEALRASPDVALWNHKWNTDVYMALRQAELHKALDTAVTQYTGALATSTAAAIPASPSALGYFCAPVEELETKVAWLLSPDVFLFACAPKILRELVASVESVLDKLLDSITVSTGGSTPAAATAQLLVQLLCDITQLQGQGVSRWLTQLTASASAAESMSVSCGGMADVVRLVQSRLLADFSSVVQARVSQAVVAESLPALENVRSVRLTYSHTKKPPPTQPSWYVVDVVKPFDALAHQMEHWGTPSQVRRTTLREVANKLVIQFIAVARDTLVAAKKTEESWEKLRKRKEATSTGAAGGGDTADGDASAAVPVAGAPSMSEEGSRVTPETASDRDKMTMQLRLDLNALLAEVAKRGVDLAHDIPACTAAFSLLRRAEWIMGADIPEPPDIEAD